SNLKRPRDNQEPQATEKKRQKTSAAPQLPPLSPDETKKLLREHKIKVKWLNAGKKELEYPTPLRTFGELRDHGIARKLVSNVEDQGFSQPSDVQMVALPLLLKHPTRNLLTVAPTGSGKTLAFMLPLIHQLSHSQLTPTTKAVVLAPTKELVGQIVNESQRWAAGTSVRISQVRKGMKLPGEEGATVKSHILISTPGILWSMLEQNDNITLSTVEHLVLDEGDILLDRLFRDQTVAIWNRLPSSIQVSLWSATMGSNIEELVQTKLDQPVMRLVVGIKGSAVANVEHRLIYAATERGKLMGLRQLLHPLGQTNSLPPLPYLVFTQTIERAAALHSELRYDIPPEAGGSRRLAVLHAELSSTAREDVMKRFRAAEIWVLITTDILARGMDFRGVNAVVNYDIPTSGAAYVHRVGRTGRAGRSGVAITLCAKEDLDVLKPLVQIAGKEEWLKALPKPDKRTKEKLKKHGLEGRNKRISTKSGYERKVENKKKGYLSKKRKD
ncbi:P-loop containing nucleoside triphosphate hydrolase protein, partial [Piedraia hortae CBS 480.64]